MASGMISPLRLAGSRLTSTTAGRAITTHSVRNLQALQEEEHEAVRQHLEAMGQKHIEYRTPLIFRSSPVNIQRVPQQDSQSGLHLQSIRSFSTSQCHQASTTTQSATTQEMEEDIHRLHMETMQQRRHQVSALHRVNGSLITNQSPLLRQNSQNQHGSQYQSERSLHTNAKVSEAHGEVPENLDILNLHTETIKQRKQQMKELHQTRGSLITSKRPVEMQQPQFQSVRSLHTKTRVADFAEDVSERNEILSMHRETINQRKQQIQKLHQTKGSLITNKIEVERIEENINV